MRRVLLVIPSMATAGGAEKLVNSIAQLLESDHLVSIATFDPPGTDPFFAGNVPLHALGGGGSRQWCLRVLDYFAAASRLRALKRRLDCDLTISVLWRADLMNALSQGRDGMLSLAVINLVNNPTNAVMVRLRYLSGLVYRRFDRVLAISPGIAEEYRALYRLAPSRLGVFKNFLAPVKPSVVYAGESPRFVFCARAVQEKNLDGLLAVFAAYTARHPGRQLVVVGDGPLLAEMKSLAGTLGLSTSMRADTDAQVLFVGSTTNPENFMMGALALLLTSRHEGVPTVAILAASLGLPLLAADCMGGGMRLLFGLPANGPLPEDAGASGAQAAGLLLPIPEPTDPNSITAWVTAMEAVDMDSHLRRRLVAGALMLAERYSPQAVRKDWVATIESIIKG